MIGIFINLWNRLIGAGGAAISYVLDEYSGAAAAYSLRKLSSTYGGSAVRVRRASDNAEQDIGFVGQDLDETALMNFVGYQNLLQRSEEFGDAYWTKTRSSVASNTNTAPNGTLTADTIECLETGFNGCWLRVLSVVANSSMCTLSIYAKKNTAARLQLRFDGIGGVVFDFNSNTVVSESAATGTMVSVGDGWYRCSASFPNTGSSTVLILVGNSSMTSSSWVSTLGESIYLWGAQLNIGTTAQPYQVTTSAARSGDGFVTRWYDQSGFIRNASQSTAANQPRIVGGGVIERENGKPTLFFDGVNDNLQSTNITLPAYTSVFLTTKTLNPAKPFFIEQGSDANTVDGFFVYGTIDSPIHVRRSSIHRATGVSGWFPMSFSLADYIYNGTFSIDRNGVDVPNGNIVGSAVSNTNTTNVLNIGSRNSASLFANSDLSELVIYPSDQTANRSLLQRNIGSYYQTHWTGAGYGLLDQFGGAAAAYSLRNLSSQYRGPLVRVRRSSDNVETDIGGTYNGDLDIASLVSFTGGQNLVLQSEDFSSASWTKFNSSITANATIAPDGALTAEKLTELALSTEHTIHQSFSVATSSIYTFSVYAKSAERSKIRLVSYLNNSPFDYYESYFDLSNGTVYKNGTLAAGSFISSSIQSLGNGWFRCSVTGNTNKTGTHRVQIGTLDDSWQISYLGVAGSGVYVWGAQLNTGILQPYIPTTTTAVNGANAFVTRWYDQSGQARDAIQATAASQPRIVNAGGVESEGNRPALFFDGVDDAINFDTVAPLFAGEDIPLSAFSTVRSSASGWFFAIGSSASSQPIHGYNPVVGSGIENFRRSNAQIIIANTDPSTIYKLNSHMFAGTTLSVSNNAVDNIVDAPMDVTALTGLDRATIGALRYQPAPNGTTFFTGDVGEFILYRANQFSLRQPIQSNINSYYQIYWQGNGTALLDSFSGASAAYSLRNLSSAYTGPLIRVRRSNDNVERDIYGTFGGDLDIASLVAFVGANSGFVTTWYDQSGSGRHAVQTTAGNQPRIVNAGVVDTNGGKPTIFFNGTTSRLLVTTGLNIIQNVGAVSMYSVLATNSTSIEQLAILISTGSPTPSRFLFGVFPTPTVGYVTGGRRLDSDSFASLYSSADTNRRLMSSFVKYTSSDIEVYSSGVLAGSNTNFQTDGNTQDTTSVSFVIGSNAVPSQYWNGIIQEMVLYSNDQSSSRTGTESNINNYYKIY